MLHLNATIAIAALSLAALGLAGLPAAALAKAPAFTGTWAANLAQCPNRQDSPDAPMILTAAGYDQHEAHCTFSNLKRKGKTWTAHEACSVEGDPQNSKIKIRVRGSRLTYATANGGAPWILWRCP